MQDGEPGAAMRFVEQVSNEPCVCSRCEKLRRDVVINAGEKHWALIAAHAEMDTVPQLTLCEPCRLYIHAKATR